MENPNLTPEEVISKIEGKIAEKTQGFATREEIDGFKSDLQTLKDSSDNTDIKTAIAKLEGMVESLKEGSKTSTKKYAHVGHVISEAFEKNYDQIKEIKEKGGVVNLEVKVADTMTIDGNYTGGTVGLSTLESGIARIVRRKPFMRQLVNTRGTSSKYVVWIEQANPDGGAGMTAEGAAKSQADFDLVEASTEVKKVTAYIKVSKEMVADLPFMQGEINGELMELVELKLDEQILYGDGLGNNLQGVNTYAQTFAAGSFAGTVPSANETDVLRIVLAQLEQNNFEGNYILLNPADIARLELTKGTSGEYTFPMFLQQDGIARIKSVPVVSNSGITEGEFLVGDFTKSNLRIRENMNIQVGYVNDDFTKNLMTILCEARAAHFVKSNHVNAFIKGDFATAIAAINV